MKYLFFNAQLGGIQNNHRNRWLICHGNRFTKEWMPKFFMFIVHVAENTGRINILKKSTKTMILLKQETAEDGMAGLQSKFQNLNAKVNQG